MKFHPFNAKYDIWMSKSINIWEYIVVQVDKNMFFVKDPTVFTDLFIKKYV